MYLSDFHWEGQSHWGGSVLTGCGV